jgi:hypothetical protein
MAALSCRSSPLGYASRCATLVAPALVKALLL